MSYKIVSKKQVDDMIITDVETTIGGKAVTLSIPHFRPARKEDIALGIENRIASESAKSDATAVCEIVLGQLELNKVVS
jgi:hypothetical protein